MKIVLSAEDIQNFNKLICNTNAGQHLISSHGGGGGAAAGGGTGILSSSGNNLTTGNSLMALQFYLKAPTAMTAATTSAAASTQHQAHGHLQSVNIATAATSQQHQHQQQQVLLVQSQTKLKQLQLKQPTIHQQHTSYHQQHQQHHPYYQNQSHQQQQQQQHQQFHSAHIQTHQQQQQTQLQQHQQQQHSNHQTKPQQQQKPLPVHALNQNSNFSAASSSTGGGTISSHAPTQQSNTTNSSLSPPATTTTTTIMRKNNNINTITTIANNNNKSTTKNNSNINSNSNSSDSGNCSTTSTTSSNTSTASSSGSSSTTATKKLKTEPELSTFQQQERLTFANTHIVWNEEQWKRVVFQDERKFNLDGPDGFSYYFHDLRNYERMLSQRPRGNSVFIYMVITAGGAIHLDATTTKQKPETSVETILRERGNIATKLGATDFVIQDHNWTTASNMLNTTQEWLSQEGIKTQRWPVIAHDINIMENIWGWLIREVYDGGRRFSRKDDLIFRIREAWTRLPMDLITNLYSTLPDRMMELYYTRGIYTNC